MKKILTVAAVAGALMLTGCTSEAEVALENSKTSGNNFELARRIVFINGITDEYLLEIEGQCAFFNEATQVQVACKQGEAEDGQALIVRHTMGLSDNVTYVVEQLEARPVDTFHYRLNFRPEVIAPYIDLETSVDLEGDG